MPDLENAYGSNNGINSGLSTVNAFIRDHTTTKEDSDGRSYMDVDVESFISRISSMKLDRLNYWSLMFSVGTNNLNFFGKYQVDSASWIKSYAYVGEKIGIKYKIKNYKWMSREPGDKYRGRFKKNTWTKESAPKEPVISDWHVLVYGSGILYNLANTGTSKDFNKPLYGLGTGLTFYNNLDLNISVGSLFSEWAPFWSIGFDIRFTEYLARLSKKRRQNQKMLSKSIKSRK